MEYLYNNHPNFDLLSNGVNAEKLIGLVKRYTPKRLYVSLDGERDTHECIRGVKGLYDKVLYVIEELREELPVSVMFTLTPFNTLEDLRHVAAVCKEKKIDMRIGIYSNMEYFRTREPAGGKCGSLNYRVQDIPPVVKEFRENYDFMMLYTLYRKEKVKLTCNSLRDSIVIYPNGDIPLCQQKEIILGNINREPLEIIVSKHETRQYHRHYRSCNECWINFHRKYDIVLYRNMEKVLPQRIIRGLWGDYSWSGNNGIRYKDLFPDCKPAK